MPLVRYRTGDRGALARGTCACGRASLLLGVVSGRETDVLELPDGSTRSPYQLTIALERVAGLARYQVVQTARDTLRATVIAECGTDAGRVALDASRALRAELPLDVRIEVMHGDVLARGARAKVRAVLALPRTGTLTEELTTTSASAQ
jgi:phenylacetate-CoA ligase